MEPVPLYLISTFESLPLIFTGVNVKYSLFTFNSVTLQTVLKILFCEKQLRQLANTTLVNSIFQNFKGDIKGDVYKVNMMKCCVI